MLTEQELQEMKKLESKLEKKVWEWDSRFGYDYFDDEEVPENAAEAGYLQGSRLNNGSIVLDYAYEDCGNDIDFIVKSRSFVPKAITEIEELRAENNKLRELVKKMAIIMIEED